MKKGTLNQNSAQNEPQNRFNLFFNSFGQHFLLKILLFLVVFGGMWQGLKASDTNDVVWTKNIGIEFGWMELADAKLSPDGNNILIATRGGVKLISTLTGSFIRDYNIPSDNIHNVVFSPDGNKFVVACWDGNAFVVDFNTGSILSILKHDAQGVNVHYFSKDGKKIFTTSGNHSKDIFVWDSDKYTLLNNFGGTKGGDADFLVFSNDEKILATVGSINNTNSDWYYILRLWSLDSFKILSEQPIANTYIKVHDMQMSPDCKYIATAAEDSTAKLWDAKTGFLIYTFIPGRINQEKYVCASKFSPDNKYLITSSDRCCTIIWDLLLKEIIKYYVQGGWVFGISSNSKYILIGTSDTLTLLNAKWEPDGIQEYQNNSGLTLYPNPAGNSITIPIERGNLLQSLNISNINSQVVFTVNQIEPLLTEMKVDLSSFLPGIYFVSVIYPQKSVTYKFEKIR